MTIYVVRHGQDESNAAKVLNGSRVDTELTELGRQQAAATAERLVDNGIEIICSSPQKRAYQTAQVIAARLGIGYVIPNLLLVDRDFGILSGKPIADIPKYSDALIRTDRVTYFLTAEGAETFDSVYERARRALEGVKSAHPRQTVLIVTHGDAAKMMRGIHNGWNWEQAIRAPYFDNAEVLELSDKVDIMQ